MTGVTSFGVFFKSLESAFNLTRATTSAILSGRMVFSGVFAFLGGWAVDRYGPRVVFSIMGFFIGLSLILTAQTTTAWQLFITYGLLLAVGTGAAYVVMISTVLRWFDQKRGLALGIVGSGGGLGVVFGAPLSVFLIDSFEWRNALMILGGIAWLVILPVSQLLKKDPYEIGALPDGTSSGCQTPEVEQGTTSPQKIPLLRMFRTTSFWSFLFIWLLMGFNVTFVMVHIVPHAIDLISVGDLRATRMNSAMTCAVLRTKSFQIRKIWPRLSICPVKLKANCRRNWSAFCKPGTENTPPE